MQFNRQLMTQYISCPSCRTIFPIDMQECGNCKTCQCPWVWEENILTWCESEKQKTVSKWKILLKKMKNQLNPAANIFLPFRYITYMQAEKYYRRTLSDKFLPNKWADHYLKNINLKPGDLVLDYGCGRGRLTALSNRIGFQTLGQDIYRHAWWSKINNSLFQVIPSHFTNLPWRGQIFSAIFCFGVLHYLYEKNLCQHIKEMFRVLKPGGYAIILEANDQGYAARLPRKQIGRLHTLTTLRTHFKSTGFEELSLTYEGFYAPLFPLFINFLRHQFSANPFDISDFDTYFESITPPKRRALWLMKIQKPSKSDENNL